MALLQGINRLAILLTGAALMREREHGTLEHLLVMPVRAVEIMLAKIIANGGVILVMAMLCFYTVLEGVLGMRVAGSFGLVVAATALYLFFAASLGIFVATLHCTMAPFALLFILVQ